MIFIDLVVHHPRRDTAKLWVATESDPADVEHVQISVHERSIQKQVYVTRLNRAPDHDLHRPGGRTRIWTFRLSGLNPDTLYDVYWAAGLLENNRYDPTSFVTLPRYLPTTSQVDAGRDHALEVVLGSCYSNRSDTSHQKRVSSRYGRIYDLNRRPPHVKFLVGDQVYIDQPPSAFRPPWMSTRELEEHIAQIYVDSWQKLAGLLKRGANILLSDDHEFWNDYPNTPTKVVWPALSRENFRRTMENIAKKFLQGYQQIEPYSQFDIGSPPQVSFFTADTRQNRSKNIEQGFMRAEDFDQLRFWLDNLTCPGVLVLSQPIFVRGHADHWIAGITDLNLPSYKQYFDLCSGLFRSRHDVLVLSGDIHYGRVGRAVIESNLLEHNEEHRVFEVVASPLALLDDTSKNSSKKDNPPAGFPAVAWPGPHAPQRGAGITYLDWVPTDPNDDEKCMDHFMGLKFSRDLDEGGIRVQVTAHLIDRGEPAWTHTFHLDRGQPVHTSANPVIEMTVTGTASTPNTRISSSHALISATRCMPNVVVPALFNILP